MNDELRHQQRHIGRYLLIHLAFVIIIPLFINIYGNILDYFIAFLAAAIVLALFDRRYGQYLIWSTLFIIYMLKEIVVSNLDMAWLILQPKPKLDPGIIAVPLTVTTGLEITVLSLAIAATPGTMIIELNEDQSGRNVLYVHTLNVHDPDKFRATIKNGFERMILYISRGATE